LDEVTSDLGRGAPLRDELRARNFAKPEIYEQILQLALLSPIEYDQKRAEVAKSLRIRVTTLDEEVQRLRAAKAERNSAERLFKDDEPWPLPVSGADLLDSIRTLAQRFLVLPPGAENAFALWVLFTHCIDSVAVAPILAVVSPTPRCGKTTVLDLLGRLVCRAAPASSVSGPVVFRCIEKFTPTLLIDEADTFLPGHNELRGILNSGHTRPTAFVWRSVGDDHEPARFSTWAPKAIACIGKLPATLEDRSIIIRVRRRLRSENIERLRHAEQHEFDRVRRQCSRWARDNSHKISSARPDVPSQLNDRAADSWEPLIAIADAAGGRWPALARETALELSGREQEPEGTGVELLHDIRTVFDREGVDRIRTEELLHALTARPGWRWKEHRHGRPITDRQLSGLLRPFDIRPKDLRFETGVAKGYEKKAFLESWERYLGDRQAQQGNTDEESGTYDQNPSATASHLLRTENACKSLTTEACCPVAACKAPDSEAEVF
jgi:hypothetical protein